MILNLSPLAAHLGESLTSLRFATKVSIPSLLFLHFCLVSFLFFSIPYWFSDRDRNRVDNEWCLLFVGEQYDNWDGQEAAPRVGLIRLERRVGDMYPWISAEMMVTHAHTRFTTPLLSSWFALSMLRSLFSVHRSSFPNTNRVQWLALSHSRTRALHSQPCQGTSPF